MNKFTEIESRFNGDDYKVIESISRELEIEKWDCGSTEELKVFLEEGDRMARVGWDLVSPIVLQIGRLENSQLHPSNIEESPITDLQLEKQWILLLQSISNSCSPKEGILTFSEALGHSYLLSADVNICIIDCIVTLLGRMQVCKAEKLFESICHSLLNRILIDNHQNMEDLCEGWDEEENNWDDDDDVSNEANSVGYSLQAASNEKGMVSRKEINRKVLTHLTSILTGMQNTYDCKAFTKLVLGMLGSELENGIFDIEIVEHLNILQSQINFLFRYDFSVDKHIDFEETISGVSYTLALCIIHEMHSVKLDSFSTPYLLLELMPCLKNLLSLPISKAHTYAVQLSSLFLSISTPLIFPSNLLEKVEMCNFILALYSFSGSCPTPEIAKHSLSCINQTIASCNPISRKTILLEVIQRSPDPRQRSHALELVKTEIALCYSQPESHASIWSTSELQGVIDQHLSLPEDLVLEELPSIMKILNLLIFVILSERKTPVFFSTDYLTKLSRSLSSIESKLANQLSSLQNRRSSSSPDSSHFNTLNQLILHVSAALHVNRRASELLAE